MGDGLAHDRGPRAGAGERTRSVHRVIEIGYTMNQMHAGMPIDTPALRLIGVLYASL